MSAHIAGSVVTFLIALLVGGLAIYLSASLVVGSENYGHAVVTALLGALVWALTAWIPLVGLLVALVAWVAVINWRYPGSWGDAAIVGVVAWLSALVILFVVNAVLGLGVRALGVPGL